MSCINKRSRVTAMGSGGGGIELLSQLPDEILTSIISFLPLKDAARTTLLSSRFRNLWTNATLNICDIFLLKTMRYYSPAVKAIDGILTMSHRGPIRSFGLYYLLSISDVTVRRLVDRWLETLARRGVERLSLHGRPPSVNHVKEFYQLPDCSMFTSSPLVTLSISFCGLPTSVTSFPRLRILCLEEVELSGEYLAGLLSSCPVLEDLKIRWCSGFLQVRICLQRLRAFEFFSNVRVNDLRVVIEDAPNLERLVVSEEVRGCIKVLRAPKLQAIRFS